MFQPPQASTDLPRNYLQFHENAFVSPLNLINVTHPAPFSFGRAPHVLQQTIPRADPSTSLPHLQSIDATKLHMYQFLAQRKLKEDRWKKELEEKNSPKQTFQQRNVRSSQAPQRPQKPPVRSASAPKRPITVKRTYINEANKSQIPPSPIHFSRLEDPFSALPSNKQNELTDVHEQLLLQLRIVHNPPPRENIIDETEQEKQRRIRLKRERIKRDSRAIYNAHQELKQILNDIRQPDANLPRISHRHLNAYRAILLAVETLANEAPLKLQDAPVQQLFTSILSALETLTNANQTLGFCQLQIDASYLRLPPSRSIHARPTSEQRPTPSNHLLPAIYNELMKKKQQQQQQRKSRVIPSVLRPRSAESVRLPRANASSIARPTISMQHKTRARSHSPLPSVRSASSVETPFHSRFTVDHILVKLAPRLLANYNGAELAKQIERAQTLIPMFLVDNRLTDDEITGRVLQMLMPRQDHQAQPSTTVTSEIFETPEEHARRVNMDVYQTQISTWEGEMSQIRQRLQNYRTNRLENETETRRTVKFQLDASPKASLPENVHIHTPLFEYALDDFVTKSTEHRQAFEQTTVPSSSRGTIRLCGLDSGKIRQIERYRKDYQSYLNRTESAKNEDFDPCQVINRLSEFLLDEALLTVVHEVELLTVELSQKLVENELLGREISLADVQKESRPLPQPYRRPPAQPTIRKHSSISPSPSIEQYNTSSFEEDLNTESRASRSEDDRRTAQRKSPMEGTGRFTTAAFEQRKLPRDRSSSSSSARTHSPAGIILKPTVVFQNPSSIRDEVDQVSDRDVDSSTSSSISKRRQHPPQQVQRHSDNEDEDDDDLLLSTRTGEKIYSTDFDESKSKLRNAANDYEDEDEDDDVADTMKLSARSVTTGQHSSSNSDED